MPTLEEVTYSRSECIETIRDYYHFLTELYMNESEIQEPPEGGWPSITPSTCGKNEEVVALLRNLPYLVYRNDGRDVQGTPWGNFQDWNLSCGFVAEGRAKVDDYKLGTEIVEYLADIPDYVVGLTLCKDDWGTFLLDTRQGVIYWMASITEIVNSSSQEPIVEYDPYEDAAENEAEWRAQATPYAVKDFFAMLKEQFLKLNFVPVSEKKVEEYDTLPRGHWDEMVEALTELRDVYRQHGWPDLERYRKQECMAAVRAVIERRGILV